MGPRASLDGCGKSRPPTGIRSPDRPARSESLYRLSYSGSNLGVSRIKSVRKKSGRLASNIVQHSGIIFGQHANALFTLFVFNNITFFGSLRK